MTIVMTAVTKLNPNRCRPREELRTAIYHAAIALVRERGFSGTSVDAIVAVAGVAKGTFFNFFPAKVDVLRAYYSQIDAEIRRLRAELDPAAPQRALRSYGEEVERILRREGRVMTELLQLTLSDPNLRRVDEASGALDADEFARFFAAARRRGRIRTDVDPTDAATALVDLWSGAMRAWLVGGATVSLADLFGARVALLFRGID